VLQSAQAARREQQLLHGVHSHRAHATGQRRAPRPWHHSPTAAPSATDTCPHLPCITPPPLTPPAPTHQADKPSDLEISFEFRKHQFIYDSEQHRFEKLKYPVKVRPWATAGLA
jgi:hypothetical protein